MKGPAECLQEAYWRGRNQQSSGFKRQGIYPQERWRGTTYKCSSASLREEYPEIQYELPGAFYPH